MVASGKCKCGLTPYSGNRVSMHQDNIVGVQACKFKFESCFRCGKTGHIAKSKVCNGTSRVRSVTEESPDEQDDHFMLYTPHSTHTVDALKSSGIRRWYHV